MRACACAITLLLYYKKFHSKFSYNIIFNERFNHLSRSKYDLYIQFSNTIIKLVLKL